MKRGRKLAFALLPALLLLLALELVARQAPWPPIPDSGQGGALEAHPTRLWSLPPGDWGDYRIDAEGLRASSVPGEGLRVLTLGDSTIFGWDLADADTLHQVLQQELAARGVATEVRCGGVPGYSTEQSLVLMEEVGWDWAPDLLVVGNLWSDLAIDGFHDRELMGWRPRWDALAKGRAWWLHRRGLAPWTGVSWPQPGEEGRRRVPLEDYAANLDTLMRQAAERDVGVVVLQLANQTVMRSGWEADRSSAPYRVAQDAVAAHHGVPVVHMRTAARASGMSPEQAFPDQIHPTAPVSRATAVWLASQLEQAGWPSRRLQATGPGRIPPIQTDPAPTGPRVKGTAQEHIVRGAR